MVCNMPYFINTQHLCLYTRNIYFPVVTYPTVLHHPAYSIYLIPDDFSFTRLNTPDYDTKLKGFFHFQNISCDHDQRCHVFFTKLKQENKYTMLLYKK